jgi:hypothetical protein
MKYFLLLVLFLVTATPALACMGDAPPVLEADLIHAPRDMLAVKAQIIKMTTPIDINAKPHEGFAVELKPIKIFQGEVAGETFVVSYGGCHNFPGKVDDIISVLALKHPEDGHLYAPQFWTRTE